MACRCWQASAWQTNAMQEVANSYRPSANSLTLVPTGTTEYITAGDSQAAVQFPTGCRFTTWLQKGVVGTLGTYPGRGLKTTWEQTGPNTRHSSLTENARRSPTLLMEVSVVRSAVLADRNFSSTESSGSKGPLWSPARTIERSQEGTRGGLEGFILLTPFRNLTMTSCFPSVARLPLV